MWYSGIKGLYDYQVIHAAAEQGNLEIFELLVKAGANPSLKDGIGQQPFHYAATGGSVDIMKYLLTKLGSKLLRVRHGIARDSAAESKPAMIWLRVASWHGLLLPDVLMISSSACDGRRRIRHTSELQYILVQKRAMQRFYSCF